MKIKNIILVILLFVAITTIAQDGSTIQSKFTTETKVIFITPFGGLPQEHQLTVDDTSVVVVINFNYSYVSVDSSTYIISEYCWDEVADCYIMLVSDKDGKYMYMLYYIKRKLFGIKYNDGLPDTWYY
jgi:hypothetical protein